MFEDETEMGEDLDVVGAALAKGLASLRNGPGMSRGGRPVIAPRPAWAAHLTGQGISRSSEVLDPLTFDCTNLTSAATTGQGIALPQRPFRGERIFAFAVLTDTTAPGVFTDASGFVVFSPAIYVGAVQVGASQGNLPFAMFVANSFGVRLAFPGAGQGTRIYAPYRSIVPLTATQTIACTITVTGKSVRLSQ